MSFREWPPQYAAHGLATFPVVVRPGSKKPLVSNYAFFIKPIGIYPYFDKIQFWVCSPWTASRSQY